MITQVFNTLYSAVIKIIGNLLPASDGLGTTITGAMNSALEYAGTFNFFFPFDTLLTILKFYLIMELLLLLWRFVLKVIGWGAEAVPF